MINSEIFLNIFLFEYDEARFVRLFVYANKITIRQYLE